MSTVAQVDLNRFYTDSKTTSIDVPLTRICARPCADGVLDKMLPKLSLVNQRGQWHAANQLVWPSANLDPAVQLCKEQADLLATIHQEQGKKSRQPAGSQTLLARKGSNELAQTPDFDAQAGALRQFLQPFWTGNVGENLPAARGRSWRAFSNGSIIGGTTCAGLKQQPDLFSENLLGEEPP